MLEAEFTFDYRLVDWAPGQSFLFLVTLADVHGVRRWRAD